MLVNIADAAPFAYVTNAGTGSGVDTVSIIDTSNNSIVKTVPVINPGNVTDPTNPFGVAVSKAGDRVYVSNQFSKTLTIIDSTTTDNAVIQTVSLPYRPGGLAVNPAGSRLYVAYDLETTVAVFDTALLESNPGSALVASVTVGTGPTGVAVNGDGSKVYVTNAGSGTVSVINTASNTVEATPTVQSNPQGIAYNTFNNKVYVANFGANSVSVITTPGNTVVNVALPSNSLPTGITVNNDGSRVYVSMPGNTPSVGIIETTGDTLLSSPTIATNDGPFGLDVNPVSGYLYVANSITSGANGTVTSYNTTTGALTTTPPGTVNVNKNPKAFGNFIGPMMYPIAVTASAGGTVTPAVGTDGNYFVASGLNSPTFTFTPSTGYKVSSVSVDSVTQGPPTPTTLQINNVTASHTLNVVFGLEGNLMTVGKGGSGSGTIVCSSVPAPVTNGTINCGSKCSETFPTGSTVTCTATAVSGSGFSGWTGCTTPLTASSNVCSGIPTSTTSLTAAFDAGGPVKLTPPGSYHSLIQAAYIAASTSPATMTVIAAYSGAEQLDFSRTDMALAISLFGGYDDISHASRTVGNTSRIGSLVVGGNGANGTSVVIDGIVIQ
jgi:YVTN family beta-propeller protein